MAARLSDLMPDWRAGSLGRVWPTPHPAEVVLAAAGATDAPTMLAFIGCPRNPEVPLSVLPVVMPLLAAAATKCLVWATDDSRSRLTVKEQEVLAQLAQGHSVRQIAETLGRSPHTVHDHVKALHRKLDASSRGELIAKALGHLPPARAQCTGDSGGPVVETRPAQPL